MATTTTPPVLDLSTQGPEIHIDGECYWLRLTDDLSILNNSENAKKFKRLDVLQGKGPLSPGEARELGRLADEICRVILDAPAAVQAKLSGMQRLGILTAFFQHLAGGTNARPQPPTKAKRSTTVN